MNKFIIVSWLLLVIIASVILFCLWWNALDNLVSDGMSKLIIVPLLLLVITTFNILLYLWFKAFKPAWYKPHFGIRLGKLDWSDVADCIIKNPLSFKPQYKHCKCLRPDNGFWLGLVYLTLIFLIYFLPIYFLCFNEQFFSSHNRGLIPGALISGVVTLILGGVGVFYNMRLQARTTHRIEWIDEMRKTITNLLEILTCYGSDQRKIKINREENKIKAKYKKNMFRLELLINPSEKEHRALLALIRRGSIFTKGQKWGGLIKGIDNCVLCHFEERVENDICKNITPCPRPKERNGKCECEYCKERYENISYIVRLSNVVMKREWEQVKYVR